MAAVAGCFELADAGLLPVRNTGYLQRSARSRLHASRLRIRQASGCESVYAWTFIGPWLDLVAVSGSGLIDQKTPQSIGTGVQRQLAKMATPPGFVAELLAPRP